MNWLDVVILGSLAWFTWAAYRSGLVREFVTLAAIILALPIAGLFYDRLATRLVEIVGDETAAAVVAFLMIFVAVIVAGQIASIALKQAVQLLHLGWADHSGGAFFGFLKGLLIVQALLILFITYPEPDFRETVADSPTASFLLDDVPLAEAFLPSEFETNVSEATPSDASARQQP
jgi:membrane protein required for colicin V production